MRMAGLRHRPAFTLRRRAVEFRTPCLRLGLVGRCFGHVFLIGFVAAPLEHPVRQVRPVLVEVRHEHLERLEQRRVGGALPRRVGDELRRVLRVVLAEQPREARRDGRAALRLRRLPVALQQLQLQPREDEEDRPVAQQGEEHAHPHAAHDGRRVGEQRPLGLASGVRRVVVGRDRDAKQVENDVQREPRRAREHGENANQHERLVARVVVVPCDDRNHGEPRSEHPCVRERRRRVPSEPAEEVDRPPRGHENDAVGARRDCWEVPAVTVDGEPVDKHHGRADAGAQRAHDKHDLAQLLPEVVVGAQQLAVHENNEGAERPREAANPLRRHDTVARRDEQNAVVVVLKRCHSPIA
mmetsp:Transcript_27309/g.84643  ORF Transcript_27309/g.84643 Transcript_27309/m.84643 type:complete len:355 (-) Transcript_27309:35-1099(-)